MYLQYKTRTLLKLGAKHSYDMRKDLKQRYLGAEG